MLVVDPKRFGAHSLRIGGASAALSAGMSPDLIRTAGRWGSDIYIIYCRVSWQPAMGISTVIGFTPFNELERETFTNESLTYTTMTTDVTCALGDGVGETYERDLIDDSLVEQEEEEMPFPMEWT